MSNFNFRYTGYEIYIFLEKNGSTICKQWRPWSDAAFWVSIIWVCTVCQIPFYGSPDYNGLMKLEMYVCKTLCLYVCVELLQPSQPNGVMSSMVSLPNNTFTGLRGFESSKWLTSIVHIIYPEIDNCPSSISWRYRLTLENILWSNLGERMLPNLQPPDHQPPTICCQS